MSYIEVNHLYIVVDKSTYEAIQLGTSQIEFEDPNACWEFR